MNDFTEELRQGLDLSPEATYARWMARADGCPDCPNVEVPHHVEPSGDDGFRAYYTCTDCRRDWWASWADIEWRGLFA